MPTDEDRLLLQQIQGFIGSLRGADETRFQGAQKGLDQQNQQFLGEQARQRQLADIASARQFATQERESAQGFRKELQAEELKGRKELSATTRKFDIQTNDQARAERQAESMQSFGRAGILTPNAEDPEGAPTLDITQLGMAKTQGKLIGDSILDLEGKTEEEFQAFADDENNRTENLRKEAIRNRVDSPALSVLIIRPNETKEQYLIRLKGFRQSLIEREFQARLAERQKDPEFGQTFPQVAAAPGVVKGGITPESIQQATDSLRFSVIQEFGGDLGQAVPQQTGQGGIPDLGAGTSQLGSTPRGGQLR